MRAIKQVSGIDGQLTLFEDRIVISREGIQAKINHGLKGDKEIFLTSITSVQFKKAGIITNGYIQFGVLGGRESRGGLMRAASDEITVTFTKYEQTDFQGVKEKVNELIKLAQSHPSTLQVSEKSDAEQIAEFASLRDQGIITEGEFEAKKNKILGLNDE